MLLFQKMKSNIKFCSENEYFYDYSINEFLVEDEEEELHYSEEFDTDTNSVETSETESLCWSLPLEKDKGNQVIPILPQLKFFCPCQKNIGQTSSMPVFEFNPPTE